MCLSYEPWYKILVLGTLISQVDKMLCKILLVTLAISLVAAQEADKKRDERLFYVTTSSSTSTLSTVSFCFQSTNAAPTTCGRRKKRSGILDEYQGDQVSDIQPHR